MFFKNRDKQKNKPLKRDQLKGRILSDIQVSKTRIPKTDGGNRQVTANNGERVTMRVGVTTKATKTTTIDMIAFAYDTMRKTGRFDSRDFRAMFPREYASGPCIYSMTGGILVELQLAEQLTEKNRTYYVPRG